MRFQRHAGRVCCLATAVSCSFAPMALAGGGILWDPAGGVGDLADPGNWIGGFPAPSGNAVFDDAGNATTATLSLPTLPVGTLSFAAGNVLLQLGNHDLISSGPIEVGTGGGTVGVVLESGTVTASALILGDGAGVQDVTLNAGVGGVWDIAGSLTTHSDALLTINGGTVSAGSLALAGSLDLQAGALIVTGNLAWADLGLPGGLSLDAGQTLGVNNAFTFSAGDSLTLNGGALLVDSFAGGGTLDYQHGTLTIQSDGLTLGAGQLIDASTTLDAGDAWALGGTLTIDAGYGLSVAGGVLNADAGVLGGGLNITGGSVQFDTLENTAGVSLFGGTLTLGALTDNAGGITVAGPATLRYTGAAFDINPGSVWGDSAYQVAADSTLRSDTAINLGTDGAGTLTLLNDAVVQTATLRVGADAQFMLHAGATIQANTIQVEGPFALETILDLHAQPWTASQTTITNLDTLTHSFDGTTTTSVRILGGVGRTHLTAGTLHYDNTAGESSGTFSTTFEIDPGAVLRFEGDSALVNSNPRAIALSSGFGQNAVENNGTLHIDGQRIVLDRSYTGIGSVVLDNQAQVWLGPNVGTTVILDLTASAGTRFQRNGSGTRFVHIHDSDDLQAQFHQGVAVSLLGDVMWNGGYVEDRVEIFGQTTLADGVAMTGGAGTTDSTMRFIAEDAALLLGDQSRFEPGGWLTVNGQIVGPGAGETAYINVDTVHGHGAIDAGAGTLDIFTNDYDTFTGTYRGDEGSHLILRTRAFNDIDLAPTAGIDSRGDVSLITPNEDIEINGPVTVDGLLTLSARNIAVLDSGEPFAINHLALDARSIFDHESTAPISITGVTTHDNGFTEYATAAVVSHGDIHIGADGIDAFGRVSLGGTGDEHNTVIVDGLIRATELTLFDTTLIVNGGIELTGSVDREIYIVDSILQIAPGTTLADTDIVGANPGNLDNRVHNYGTMLLTQQTELTGFDLTNYGTLRYENAGTISNSSVLVHNEGVIQVAQTGLITLLGNQFTQGAAGSLVVEGHVQGNAFDVSGTFDFTGGSFALGELRLNPDAQVVTLGNVTTASTSYITRLAGTPITVDDLHLDNLRTRNGASDGVRVRGRLVAEQSSTSFLPVLLEGTLEPTGTDNGFANNVFFRRGLTLTPDARVELDIETTGEYDAVNVIASGELDYGGATLVLDVPRPLAQFFEVGDSVRVFVTDRPQTGAFGTVEGLNLSDALRWELQYDAAGLLLEVQLAGDIDGDGFVGAADLDVVLAHWGDAIHAGTGADLTGDGAVGQADLDIVISRWGQSTPTAPDVPEPGSLALLLAGAALLQRRRRA